MSSKGYPNVFHVENRIAMSLKEKKQKWQQYVSNIERLRCTDGAEKKTAWFHQLQK